MVPIYNIPRAILIWGNIGGVYKLASAGDRFSSALCVSGFDLLSEISCGGRQHRHSASVRHTTRSRDATLYRCRCRAVVWVGLEYGLSSHLHLVPMFLDFPTLPMLLGCTLSSPFPLYNIGPFGLFLLTPSSRRSDSLGYCARSPFRCLPRTSE